MVFRPDGTVRTTDGWTDHRRASRPATTLSPRNFARADVLDAINATSSRHRTNRALAGLGLGAEDWHILFRALIEAESAYQPEAMSPRGAFGLGQLMPETARLLGVDRRDIAQNLDGSARYLLAQLAAFGDVDLALAAYNAGPHRVTEYGGVPPFDETRSYIARVHRIRTRLSDRRTTSSRDEADLRGRSAVVLGRR